MVVDAAPVVKQPHCVCVCLPVPHYTTVLRPAGFLFFVCCLQFQSLDTTNSNNNDYDKGDNFCSCSCSSHLKVAALLTLLTTLKTLSLVDLTKLN